MSEIRKITFPEKDQPLRDDVSLLGRLLGEVMVEQDGEELLRQVEMVRKAAILRREGESESAQTLEHTLAELSTARLRLIIKAFSSYLRLVNLAEEIHRVRRNRAYLKSRNTPQRGSLKHVLAGLKNAAVSTDHLQDALDRLQIQPVFTAHPTEATRRSILEKEYSIVHRLVERLNPDLTPAEDQQALARIRDAVTSGWQTRAAPKSKPTVADELDNILFYLTEIIYRVVPAFEESLGNAIRAHYRNEISRDSGKTLVSFGSWVGGDMDGNPNVTSTTISETLATQRQSIIRCYLTEINRIARYLSQTRGEAGFSDRIESRLRDYAKRYPDIWAQIPRRHLQMPYRCFLKLIAHRLNATLSSTAPAYTSLQDFQEDVELIEKSLEANKGIYAGLFGVNRLLVRTKTFGFHLASLDVRQDAYLHRLVLGELLGIEDWVDWPVEKRTQALGRLLAKDQISRAPDAPDLSGQAAETLNVFRAIGEAQLHFGNASVGLFIISMTQGADDVLTALALARFAGLEKGGRVPLDITPLLETVDDLDAGPDIFAELLQQDCYQQHLQQRDHRQVIMVGYSDSNKDAGIVSSRWGLHHAQIKLKQLAEKNNVQAVFFHGRGGTVSRGGGNLVSGITGAPANTVNGYVRVTEQGEVINQKYGMRALALRNLELVAGAALQHQLSDVGQYPDNEMRQLMVQMAEVARRQYHELVHDTPAFIDFFRNATPIDVIERLAIGSRPASRRSGEGIANLRAIPWVFSWAQTRIGFPGVFGMGTALEFAVQEAGIEALRNMFKRWSFFRGMINDVEMVLAKSELEIGRRYAQLANSSGPGIFGRISTEFDIATNHLLNIKQFPGLLEDQHTLRRNIRLRNPYVDPLHIVQIDLLQRWRDSGRRDQELLDALKASVNGIALGIQNTG